MEELLKMSKYKSSFIILEDSICLAPSKGCRTPDIVDIDNGIVCHFLLFVRYIINFVCGLLLIYIKKIMKNQSSVQV